MKGEKIPTIPPPSGYISRLDPMLAAGLEQNGYDPEYYRQQLNEMTRRRLEIPALIEGVEAIDAEYRVVSPEEQEPPS